jgi:hypothetical protein
MLFSPRNRRTSKVDRLRLILSDGQFHTTRELVRRIGHTFGVAIFKLRRMHRQVICQLQPGTGRQYRYRLVPRNG